MFDTLVHDIEIEVCKRRYVLRRSNDLLRRVEGAVGAVYPFAQRLEQRGCTSSEIARLYLAIPRDLENCPSGAEIDAWVFETGLAHARLAMFLVTLTIGSEELARIVRKLELHKGVPADDADGPFATTAASTGTASSGLRTDSAGHHRNSGAPATTN